MTTDPVLVQLCGGDPPPLSFVDLYERGTFDLELGAWLMARVAGGDSWITGSGPGGIGKTTLMRSLLSFVPAGYAFAEALPGQVAGIAAPPRCVVSHELSDHPPPTYLWDQDLRQFFALAVDGHILAGNVHADDADQVRSQVVDACGVPEDQFRAVQLLAFLRMEGQDPAARRIRDTTSRRYFERVYWSAGDGPHACVYTAGAGLAEGPHRDPEAEAHCRAFLATAGTAADRTIAGLRARFLGGDA